MDTSDLGKHTIEAKTASESIHCLIAKVGFNSYLAAVSVRAMTGQEINFLANRKTPLKWTKSFASSWFGCVANFF